MRAIRSQREKTCKITTKTAHTQIFFYLFCWDEYFHCFCVVSCCVYACIRRNGWQHKNRTQSVNQKDRKISLCMPGRTRTYVRGNFIAARMVVGAKAMKGGVRKYYKYLLYYTPLCYKPRSDIRLLLGDYWVIIRLFSGRKAEESLPKVENHKPI